VRLEGFITRAGAHGRHVSLEARRKELTKVKDDLLKQSKAKQTTADNVKAQLDSLMKVSLHASSEFC
jgi:hypothetical protein